MNSVEQQVTPDAISTQWFLLGAVVPGSASQQVLIQTSRFQIGRRPDLQLCIPRASISKLHAEFVNVSHILFLRDLHSTNGTFLNGQRITTDTPVKSGDIVQFADVEFRVTCSSTEQLADRTVTSTPQDYQWAISSVSSLVHGRQLIPYFQPIVRVDNHSVIAYEVLARSGIPRLKSPLEMFHAAGLLGMQQQLSELSREMGAQAAKRIKPFPQLFLNTHPSEHDGPGLIKSLESLLRTNGDLRIVLELHEGALTDVPQMRALRDELHRLGIQLAFDDFGAGQSRLVELAEISPDVLKFDMTLIRDIHLSQPRQQLVGGILKLTRDLGITSLAEGIESVEEGEMCQDLGFELAQGYYYGRPAKVEDIASSVKL